MKSKDVRALVRAFVAHIFLPFFVSVFLLFPRLRPFVHYHPALAWARRISPFLALAGFAILVIAPFEFAAILKKEALSAGWAMAKAVVYPLNILFTELFFFLVGIGISAALRQENQQERAARMQRYTFISVALGLLSAVLNQMPLAKLLGIDANGYFSYIPLEALVGLALQSVALVSSIFFFCWIYQLHQFRLALTIEENSVLPQGYAAAPIGYPAAFPPEPPEDLK